MSIKSNIMSIIDKTKAFVTDHNVGVSIAAISGYAVATIYRSVKEYKKYTAFREDGKTFFNSPEFRKSYLIDSTIDLGLYFGWLALSKALTKNADDALASEFNFISEEQVKWSCFVEYTNLPDDEKNEFLLGLDPEDRLTVLSELSTEELEKTEVGHEYLIMRILDMLAESPDVDQLVADYHSAPNKDDYLSEIGEDLAGYVLAELTEDELEETSLGRRYSEICEAWGRV